MFRVAVGQICSTASMTGNLAQCRQLAERAVSQGAKALFLPEASDYISSSAEESLSLCQLASDSPFVVGLSDLARRHSLYINVGIHEPTTPPSQRLSNTLVWISPGGKIIHRYAKLHVFDIDLSATGGPVLKESNSTEPGKTIVPPFSTPDFDPERIVFGSQICFDMRFPEPALALRRLSSTILLYPSAFTVPTGHLHWEILLRARAIETQSFVIASAQCGRHNEKRTSYGDSIVIDPNGVVLGRLEKVQSAESEEVEARKPDLLVVDLDMESLPKIRRGIPLLRRTDVYGVV